MQANREPVTGSAVQKASIAPPETVARILVCQLRQIGDVLLTTPSIELLGRTYPNAELHVFTEKKCLPMLKNNPHVDAIWPVDKAALGNPLREYLWYRKVAGCGFDLVVDFQQLPRCRAVPVCCLKIFNIISRTKKQYVDFGGSPCYTPLKYEMLQV